MKNEDIIRKIKKLIAIAGDSSASDQEIQLAAYRARKLMLQHHIEEYELNDMQENKDVVQIVLQRKSSGYAYWVLRALSEAFRCKSAYRGKINTNQCTFVLTGLKNDIEILRPLAEGILYYLDSTIRDLQECYIGYGHKMGITCFPLFSFFQVCKSHVCFQEMPALYSY